VLASELFLPHMIGRWGNYRGSCFIAKLSRDIACYLPW